MFGDHARGAIMKNDNLKIIDILRHSRHDWLNKLQLIKGNIALNKLERVNEIIDEIVMEANHHTRLSNLNIPKFATFILTYNWKRNKVTLEFEVWTEGLNLAMYDDCLLQWSEAFLDVLNNVVQDFSNNHLMISIQSLEQTPRFFFDFRGIIRDVAYLEDWLNTHQTLSKIHIVEKDMNREELTLALSVK